MFATSRKALLHSLFQSGLFLFKKDWTNPIRCARILPIYTRLTRVCHAERGCNPR